MVEKNNEQKLLGIEIEHVLNGGKKFTEKQKTDMLNIIETLKETSNSKGLNSISYNYKISNEGILTLDVWHGSVGFHYYKDIANKHLNVYMYKGELIKDIKNYSENSFYNYFKNMLVIDKEIFEKVFSKDKISVEEFLSIIESFKGTFPIYLNKTYSEELVYLFKKLDLDSTIRKYKFSDEDWTNVKNRSLYGRFMTIITKVIEHNNLRFVEFYSFEQNEYVYGLFMPKHPEYNLMDVNRFVIFDNYFGRNDSYNLTCLNTNEEKTTKELSILYGHLVSYCKSDAYTSGRFSVVSLNEILSRTAAERMRELKEEQDRKIRDIKNAKYRQMIENMDKVPFEKNNMKFTNDSLTYEGIEFDVKGLFSFKDLLSGFEIDDIADYNTIVNNTLRMIALRWVAKDKYEFSRSLNYSRDEYKYERCIEKEICNQPTITIKLDGKTIVLDKTAKYTVNGIRINRMEIGEVLTHILCHKDEKSFNDFLEIVSKCSLKFANAISNNLKKSINFNGKQEIIEIKLKRSKNRNYLIVDGKEYAVKDSNGLIDFNGYYAKDFALKVISTTELPIDKLELFFGDARKRALLAIKKSKDLLNNTMKELDVTIKTIDKITGYCVKGSSGKEYLIEEDSKDGHVGQPKTWEVRGDKLEYRCVVNKSNQNQVGYDALVARLYALKNDSFIAKDVNTLRV